MPEADAVADDATYTFTTELFEWQARAAWYFFAVSEEVTDEIDERHGGSAAGFGSIKVEATIGATSWTTSTMLLTPRWRRPKSASWTKRPPPARLQN